MGQITAAYMALALAICSLVAALVMGYLASIRNDTGLGLICVALLMGFGVFSTAALSIAYHA